ncbi:alanine-zipper protein, partial [Moraxella sp. VT-16-12]|uniref:alanine-zipper protein n=1 Tax=Moraxella sp. VT-16-12 TaxID=2014877 RepID=UPI001645DFD0
NNAKTQEIANLTQTVSGHTSSIRELGVTTGNLTQKYSQLKTVADKATSDITQIKQTQAGQATSIDRLDAKFDNLAVGGCNLLRNSQAERTVANATTQENFIPAYVLTKSLEPNTAYVLSYEYKTTNNTKTAQVGFVSSVGQHKFKTNLVRTSDWKKDTFKFTTGNNPNQAGHIRFDNEGTTNEQSASLWVRNVKLELGSIPSDYTPAPEDIQANIDTAKTETLANINTVRETLTNADIALGHRIDATSAEFKQADNTIKASVQAETTARTNADAAIAQTVNALKSEYNNNKSSVASQIKTLTDAKNSQATQISQITANVTTVQQTANTANSKADTATTKADDGIRRANNAQNTANTASHKADTANTNAQNAKRVADDALGKATQAQADIIAEQQARADAESSLARQMSALDSKFTTADNAIKASVAQAQQTATNAQQALATAQNQLNAKIDGISVGGRNLIPNTQKHGNVINGVFEGFNLIKLKKPAQNYIDYQYRLTRAMHESNCVFSFWAKADVDNVIVTAHLYSPNTITKAETSQGRIFKRADGMADITLSSEWQKYYVVYTQTPSDTPKAIVLRYQSSRLGSEIFIAKPKLETGNIATDWSPAPEDVQADIDQKASTASLDEFKQAQATKEQATAQRIAALDAAYKL